MLYFIILILLAFFAITEMCGCKKLDVSNPLNRRISLTLDKILFIYIAFILMMLCSLRYQTGRDWKNYIYFFNNCLNLSEKTAWERGYVFFNIFFKKYFDSFYIMQFFLCSLSAFLIYRNIYKNSDYPILILFLYFSQFYLTMEMAQTRQFISIAILCCGNKFIKKRDFFKWFIIFIFAMQFHFSVVFAFPLYFTTYRKCSSLFCIFCLLLIFVLTFFGKYIVSASVLIVGSLPFMPPRVTRLLEMYIYNKTTSNYAEMGTGLSYFGKIAIALILIFFCYKNKQNKSENVFLLNFLISLIFMAVGRNFQVLGRIINYYLICGNGFCAISVLCSKDFFWKKIYFIQIVSVFLIILFYVLSFISNWENMNFARDYLPYHSVFSGGL